MAIKKIAKKIELDLSQVPTSQRSSVKKEIGDFIVNEILKDVEQGKSPVSGEGKFKRLNKEYAKKEKGGNTTANLELDGDMLDSLTFNNTKGGIEVGIFKSSEVPKADGHNNFSGKSSLPRRRFIPNDKQSFKRGIESEVERIVQENERTRKARPGLGSIVDVSTTAAAAIEVTDLFDDFLEEFLDGQS